MNINNLIAKWEAKVKEEKDELRFDAMAGVDPLYRNMSIDVLKECIADLKKLRPKKQKKDKDPFKGFDNAGSW